MTPLQALQLHQQICDELHELALEENRFLQQNQRPTDPAFLERKRGVLAKLDQALEALRQAPREADAQPAFRQALDKARARVLQILQVDKENEQLLLRCSRTGARPSPVTPTLPAGVLQKIYQRHS